MAACTHLPALEKLSPPKLSQSVHREECTQCFDNQVRKQGCPSTLRSLTISQDGPEGIDVCLSCFNGGCLSEERHHARTHAEKTGHIWTLNVKRSRMEASPKRVSP